MMEQLASLFDEEEARKLRGRPRPARQRRRQAAAQVGPARRLSRRRMARRAACARRAHHAPLARSLLVVLPARRRLRRRVAAAGRWRRSRRSRSAARALPLQDRRAAGQRRIGRLVWRGGISMTGQLAQFRRLVGPARLARRPHPDLDLRRGRLAHRHHRLRRARQSRRAEQRADRPAARPRRPAARRARPKPTPRHGAPARRLVAGRLRAPSPAVALSGRSTATPTPFDGPAEIGRQPANGGIEALTALADGRIIADQRGIQRSGRARWWAGSASRPRDGRYAVAARSATPRSPTSSRPRSPCCPTARSPRIERAFDMARGVRCRVMRFEAVAAQAGRHGAAPRSWRGSPRPMRSTIWKGLAATRGARGETLLWLISDDNFNPLQRNILLLFELAQVKARPSSGLLGVLLGLGRDDAALQHLHLGAELAVVGAQQVGVDAAIVLDGLHAARGEPQAHRMAERIRQDRADLQVGHEPAPGLVVGVAHIVAVLHGLCPTGRNDEAWRYPLKNDPAGRREGRLLRVRQRTRANRRQLANQSTTRSLISST